MKETLKEGYTYIPDIGGMTHPLSNQWDDGVNPIDQLNKLMTIRRRLLDNFSEKAIPKDAPMATLEEVLVPIYLLHRYQVEAVAKSLGGLYFTHAVKNDGEIPTTMVDPAEQWRAFDALMATITPDALSLPEALIQKIPPRPSGYPSTIEIFRGHTGPTFDPIGAAETAAGNTLDYLLNPERAARLIEYQSRDAGQPGLMAVLDKLLDRTWKAPLAAGYSGELQVLVDNLVLKNILALAASPRNAENVRGEAMHGHQRIGRMDEEALASKPRQGKRRRCISACPRSIIARTLPLCRSLRWRCRLAHRSGCRICIRVTEISISRRLNRCFSPTEVARIKKISYFFNF